MERFLDAIHFQGREIKRSSNQRGFKFVDNEEIAADALEYFSNNKRSMQKEFYSELAQKIGLTKAKLFCETASTDW